MAEAYDIAFRERAARAYNAGEGGYHELARVFGIAFRTLQRWVAQYRATGELRAQPKGGGWSCPIDLDVLRTVVREAPDGTVGELRWEYNRRVPAAACTNDSSFLRAMRRDGFVHKKPGRARPKSIAPTWRWPAKSSGKKMKGVGPNRLVFLDEAGANIAMGRSHVWVRRGEEYVEPRPMNWGDKLTLIGAVRRRGWVTLATQWGAANKISFTAWVRDRLAPRLRRGDIVLLDNLQAHKAPAVAALIAARGATEKFLPPYSHDFNPIESVWALVKKDIKTFAPRSAGALRRAARAARHAVTPQHCRRFFTHIGYVNSTA